MNTYGHEHYADDSPYPGIPTRHVEAKSNEDMKKLCQKLWIGFITIQSELKNGSDISDALEVLKKLAFVGQSEPVRGMGLSEQVDMGKFIRSFCKPRNKLIYLRTQINGKKRINHEGHGGNVGPVVEPEVHCE